MTTELAGDPATSTAYTPAPSHAPNVNWLRHLRVAVVGSSPSLDVAAGVLRQLGATVSADSPLELSEAAVVLADRTAAPTEVLGTTAQNAMDYAQQVLEANQSVWVTASAFGLSSTRADEFASDLTLLAAGGILGHSRVGDDLPPIVPPGHIALNIVGYVMAVAALHGVYEHRSSARPVHVDVSAQAAVISTGLTLEMAHALMDCPDEGGSARYGAPSGFFKCLDGFIYVLVLEQHQWSAFQKVMAPLLDGVTTLADARNAADFVNESTAEWASHRTVEDCERQLQLAGVPCTEVNSLQRFGQRAKAIGRHFDLAGLSSVPLPAEVTEVTAAAQPAVGTTRQLSELRILDAGHVLAIPLGAAWLGAMGATVYKLEDPDRLDIYRRRGPFALGEAGLNRSAYFNQLNFCKQSVDHAAATGPVDLSSFDVVLQNLTGRRAQVVGVDADSVLSNPNPVLAISSSGFGSTGEWSGYRAYGHNIHAFAGLVAATKDPRGGMGDMGTPWADPLTSVAVAAWVLAWSLAPDKSTSTALDISMAELTAAQVAELVGQDLTAIYRAPDVGGDFFIRQADTTLLAVSLRSESDVRLFEDVVGQRLPSTIARGDLVDLPDDSPADLAMSLRNAGVLLSPVVTAHSLADDPFTRSTDLFQPVTSSALDRYDVTGLPWHFLGQQHQRLTAAPERTDEDQR